MTSTYYKQIDGEKYDKSLLDKADELIKGKGDGRISKEDMGILYEAAKDGNKITTIELKTLHYICVNYNCTHSALHYLIELLIKKD